MEGELIFRIFVDISFPNKFFVLRYFIIWSLPFIVHLHSILG